MPCDAPAAAASDPRTAQPRIGRQPAEAQNSLAAEPPALEGLCEAHERGNRGRARGLPTSASGDDRAHERGSERGRAQRRPVRLRLSPGPVLRAALRRPRGATAPLPPLPPPPPPSSLSPPFSPPAPISCALLTKVWCSFLLSNRPSPPSPGPSPRSAPPPQTLSSLTLGRAPCFSFLLPSLLYSPGLSHALRPPRSYFFSNMSTSY